MELLRQTRNACGISQRALARKAEVSYKAIQLIEAGHDVRLSTLNKIALGLDYPSIYTYTEHFFELPADSVYHTSCRIVADGVDSWKIHVFDFVDSFRARPCSTFVKRGPTESLGVRLAALYCAVAASLCRELNISVPHWCNAFPPLEKPWFVSGVENLKAFALIESPVEFRARNIFVLNNFLDRA